MIDGHFDKFKLPSQCHPGRKCLGTCQGVLIHFCLRILLMAEDPSGLFIKCARTRINLAWKGEDSWKHGRSHQILIL